MTDTTEISQEAARAMLAALRRIKAAPWARSLAGMTQSEKLAHMSEIADAAIAAAEGR
jgi:hypothetical protein